MSRSLGWKGPPGLSLGKLGTQRLKRILEKERQALEQGYKEIGRWANNSNAYDKGNISASCM